MFKKRKMENKAEEIPTDLNSVEENNEVLNENFSDNLLDEINTDDKAVSETEDLQTLLNTANDKYLRLFAEFDNYKRRTSKERIELFKSAGKDIVIALLPALDDFERAIKAIPDNEEGDGIKEGIVLVQNKLKAILQQQGLKEMNSISEVFDADLHEAITSIPAPVDDMKGKIIDELEKGYYLNDKVIRFAKVIVGA